MEDVKERKQKLRKEMENKLANLPVSELNVKSDRLISRLFDFANFMESESALFYFRTESVLDAMRILNHVSQLSKTIVLPCFADKRVTLWRIENPESDIIPGPTLFEPDIERCKAVSFDAVEIAIVPGVAFDEKGGRLGSGLGHYDRLIPKLAGTVRKVAIAFEDQIIPHVPMESNDKFVDIIITEKRTIYKI